jgi:hypothetical protein
MICALVALRALVASVAFADDEVEPVLQAGENRWVPSFAIKSGITIQKQRGTADSLLFQDGSSTSVPLRGFVGRTDVPVSPFVGGSLEVMTPAFAIPTRPRLFLSAEYMPMFANDHSLAIEGDPGCIRSPLQGSPCAHDVTEITPQTFDEGAANGKGSRTSAQIDSLAFSANLGVAFPFQFRMRQMRIKPSIGWINYKVDANGFVSDAACNPSNQCTDSLLEIPPLPPIVVPGFLREVNLKGNGSEVFNGIGPALDLDMDVGRYGPLGVSLLVGASAYKILGNRDIKFQASQSFNDELGNDVATASFKVKVNPWLFRGNLGIRFQWLGALE